MNKQDLCNIIEATIEGTFEDLSIFDFNGVYVIYNPNNNEEIVYVGSAYSQTIKERLSQYISEKDTGNTLMHAICKTKYSVETIDRITEKNRKDALKLIKQYKVIAIEHKDLEYTLIKELDPLYNTYGKSKQKK